MLPPLSLSSFPVAFRSFRFSMEPASHGNVRVMVRVRPLNDREKDADPELGVQVTSETTLTVVPPSKKEGASQKEFGFDHILWSLSSPESPAPVPFSDQEAVYKTVGLPLVDSMFKGYNVCLFAYGQTGAGKTFSMMGLTHMEAMRGIIPRMCDDVFKRISEAACSGNKKTTYAVKVAMLEIYHDHVQDLLKARSANLKIRMDPKKGPLVQDLSEKDVTSSQEVAQVLETGSINRTVAATSMNAVSSRAHTVVQFSIDMVDHMGRIGAKPISRSRCSRALLADLAGNERIMKGGGGRLKDDGIASALSALETVIRQLAKKDKHIPYRSNNLTIMMCQGLGGSCHTTMLAPISPAGVNYQETRSTLEFASIARQIVNKPRVNITPAADLIQDLQEELAQLQQSSTDHLNAQEMLARVVDLEVVMQEVHVLETQEHEEAQKRVKIQETKKKDQTTKVSSAPIAKRQQAEMAAVQALRQQCEQAVPAATASPLPEEPICVGPAVEPADEIEQLIGEVFPASDPMGHISKLQSCWHHQSSGLAEWAKVPKTLLEFLAQVLRDPKCPVLGSGQTAKVVQAATAVMNRLQEIHASQQHGAQQRASPEAQSPALTGDAQVQRPVADSPQVSSPGIQELIAEVFPAADPVMLLGELRSCWQQHNFELVEWDQVLQRLLDFLVLVLQDKRWQEELGAEQTADIIAAGGDLLSLLPVNSSCQDVRSGQLTDSGDQVANADSSPAEGHAVVQKGGFLSFKADRFKFVDCRPEPLQEWLSRLPQSDPHGRFTDHQINALLDKWSESQPKSRDAVLEAVRQHAAKEGIPLATKIEQDILAMPEEVVEPEHCLALLAYSVELYEDKENKMACKHQIYKEFNTVCREYAHVDTPSDSLLEAWEFFKPFAFHLNAAIKALPTVCTVLYRGGGYFIDTAAYPLGYSGSWGGCISASSDRHQAVNFVSSNDALKATKGCYFIILSDEARPMYNLSAFPEEMEHLHPLDQQLEICSVLPTSILQMLSLNISIITLKLSGKTLPLALHFAALDGMQFIYDDFLQSYVPPFVKLHPLAKEAFPIESKVTEFVQQSAMRVVLITARAGMGKTSCALWLVRETQNLGRAWLLVSLPSVQDPFAPQSLVRHLQKTFGFKEQEMERLRKHPLVLILDSLDEVHRDHVPTRTWWELNGFQEWNVMLFVTCREEHIQNYGRCLGDPSVWYIQGFGEEQTERYLRMRLLPCDDDGVSHAERGRAQGAGSIPAQNTIADVEQRVQEMMQQIHKSPIRTGYSVPFRLSMGVDLSLREKEGLSEVFGGAWRACELYERWLQHSFRQKGTDEGSIQHAMDEAEALAWDLHCKGCVQAQVGDLGASEWFRRCPLRVHDFHPQSYFSFKHKSIQEFLVALHLWRCVKGHTIESALQSINVVRDFPVLRFFGDLFRGKMDGPQQADAQEQLLHCVLQSRSDNSKAQTAANSISLLIAAGVSLAGQDLSGIQVPNAMLQCAKLSGAALCGANLQGADIQGALLDLADLRGADLTDVHAAELLRTLEGHSGAVLSVGLSANNEIVVTGSQDRTIRVWKASTEAHLRTLEGHSGDVTSVDLAAGGQLLVSGSLDQTVGVWKTTTGELLRLLRGHSDGVRSVAVSSDGETVVSGSQDMTVCVWKRSTGELLRTLKGHTDAVFSVTLSTNGQRVASGSADTTVRIWDASTGECCQELQGHTARVCSVALSVDGKVGVSGSLDKTIRICKADTGELLQTLAGHTDWVRSVALSRDGQMVVSSSDDASVRIWNATTGELLLTLEGHQSGVGSIALSIDGQTVASGSTDGTARVWKASRGELLQTSDGHSGRVHSVAVSGDGQTVISGSQDATIRVWKASTAEPLQTSHGHTGDILSLALSGDGATIVSGSQDICLWDASTGQLRQTLKGHSGRVSSVALSRDGQTLASASIDNTVRVWNARTGQHLRTLEGHAEWVRSVAVSSDGGVLVSGSDDALVIVWNAAEGELVQRLEGHAGAVFCVALSIDSQLIASGSVDAKVCVWNALTGGLLQTLSGHTAAVRSVALSADKRILVSGSEDKTICVWGPSTGALLQVLQGHTDWVRTVALSDDAQTLVSGSRDTTVRIWTAHAGRGSDAGVQRSTAPAADGDVVQFLNRHVLREVSAKSCWLSAPGAKLSTSTRMPRSVQNILLEKGARFDDEGTTPPSAES